MRLRISVFWLAFSLTCGSAQTFGAGDTLVHAGRVIDVQSKRVIKKETIVIHDEKIVRVESGFTVPSGTETVIVDSATDARRVVREHKRAADDLIKIMLSGGVGSIGPMRTFVSWDMCAS